MLVNVAWQVRGTAWGRALEAGKRTSGPENLILVNLGEQEKQVFI